MALDFKQNTKKPHYKPKFRGTKWYKNLEGEHIPTRKLLHYAWVGSDSWIRCNINRWLYKQLDRPVDDVFSDFVREFKKTFRGANTSEEIFYKYVDKEKDDNRKLYWIPKFYVSEGGFLCKYKNLVSPRVFNRRRRPSQANVDFNIKVLKSLKIGEDEAGPKYVGKLWVRVKGITKVLNTWLVREVKLNGGKGFIGRNKLSEAEKYNLSLYTIANVEGIGSKYDIDQHPHNCMVYFNPFVYRFIVKLSDLK